MVRKQHTGISTQKQNDPELGIKINLDQLVTTQKMPRTRIDPCIFKLEVTAILASDDESDQIPALKTGSEPRAQIHWIAF